MNLSRVRYRIHQFIRALWASADPEELASAQTILTPEQMALFKRMQPGEQAHALSVYSQLVAHGETVPDLLVAALLHDVGKSCHPLRLWERVLIVLARAILPKQAGRWGNSSPQPVARRFWTRPFVIAEQHPAWGADLAASVGASPRAVTLIRLHQDSPSSVTDVEVKRLLVKLQAVDDST